MLVPLFLFTKKLLSAPTFYISAYFEANRDRYYHHLRAISEEDDWNGWIHFFLTALYEQALENTKKAKAILELYQKMKADIPEITHSRYAIRAIDTLFNRPIFLISDFVKESKIPKNSSYRILDALEKNGIIDSLIEGKGRKATVMIFTKLLDIAEN